MQYKICRRCNFYVQAKAKVCHACGFGSFFQVKKEAEKPDYIRAAVQKYAELARSLKKIATTSTSSLYDPSQRFSD